MVKKSCFSHECPGEKSLESRLRGVDYLIGALIRWTCGENIAYGGERYGTPKAMVKGWMNSPPHRANILNPLFKDVGVGFMRRDAGRPQGRRRHLHDRFRVAPARLSGEPSGPILGHSRGRGVIGCTSAFQAESSGFDPRRPLRLAALRSTPSDAKRSVGSNGAHVESAVPRGVAQSGSALGWGPSGRWFKSSRPDSRESFPKAGFRPRVDQRGGRRGAGGTALGTGAPSSVGRRASRSSPDVVIQPRHVSILPDARFRWALSCSSRN